MGVQSLTSRGSDTIKGEGDYKLEPKFRVGTDGETEDTTTLSPARKEWLWYHTIKGEGDTALEAEAQLYSDNSVDLKIMQVKECKAIRPAR